MAEDKKPICGVIRPIAQMGDYSGQHWLDVAAILNEAITAADLEPRLVSDADGIGVIQGRIVKNLYSDRIVVCDVSGKNPNVMFELGMRLAFDKPVVVVKDDATTYSFDTSPIEHLTYPRTLHYGSIVDFKEKLTAKLLATLKAAEEPGTKSFLQHFGPIKVAELGKETVPGYELLMDEIREMKGIVRTVVEDAAAARHFRNAGLHSGWEPTKTSESGRFLMDLEGVDTTKYAQIVALLPTLSSVDKASTVAVQGKIMLSIKVNRLDGYTDDDAARDVSAFLKPYKRRAKAVRPI